VLEEASFHVKHPAAHPLYALAAPVTPARAARVEGVRVDLDAVQAWVEAAVRDGAATPALVVETAGGVFSPLAGRETNFELARRLEPACWVLVAADRLGVLHEVGATVRAMRALGRAPDWVVLSSPAAPDESTGTNAEELGALGLGVRTLSLRRGDAEALTSLLEA
jgi:dethiobiotin synthetase